MLVPVSNIIIPSTYNRDDAGDLSNLMESIQKIGLLHPIGISNDSRLIYGLRRLIATKRLGGKEIEATVHSCGVLKRKLMELDENLSRVDLRWNEIARCRAEYHALCVAGKDPEIERNILMTEDLIGELEKIVNRSSWRIQDTAEILGCSTATLTFDIAVTIAIRKNPDLWKCKTKEAALSKVYPSKTPGKYTSLENILVKLLRKYGVEKVKKTLVEVVCSGKI